MAVTSFRHGALHVVQQTRDKDTINRLLRELDPRLFVERQLTLDGEVVWCVVEDVGLGHPPVTVYELRDSQGRPISELTEMVVDEMRRRARRGLEAEAVLRQVDRANQRKRSEQKSRVREGFDESLKDWERVKRAQQIIPRSVGLRMARDRQRAKGKRDGEF